MSGLVLKKKIYKVTQKKKLTDNLVSAVKYKCSSGESIWPRPRCPPEKSCHVTDFIQGSLLWGKGREQRLGIRGRGREGAGEQRRTGKKERKKGQAGTKRKREVGGCVEKERKEG